LSPRRDRIVTFRLETDGVRPPTFPHPSAMHLRPILVSFVALALVASTPLRAAEGYLANFDAISLLPPPPAVGTAEDRAELDTTYRVHTAASPADIALGTRENKLTIFQLTATAVPWFRPGTAPKTEALLKRVEAETKAVTDAAKDRWRHPRPYHEDPARFSDAIEHESAEHYSYPSGHSTRGTVFSLVLAELFPENRDAILAKGREAGWLRVEGGVHFLSDIYAGRVLGQALARSFLASASFQQDLAAAKAELAALRPR